MRMYAIPMVLAGALMLSPQGAAAEVMVDSIALAEDVQDREPIGLLTPAASCQNGQNGGPGMPVFDSSVGDTVYFWSRVQTTSSGMLRHTWYQNGDNGWTELADVELPYSESPGYRTWSSKKIVPSLHMGDWKVEVSTSDNPGHVLCTARFQVK